MCAITKAISSQFQMPRRALNTPLQSTRTERSTSGANLGPRTEDTERRSNSNVVPAATLTLGLPVLTCWAISLPDTVTLKMHIG